MPLGRRVGERATIRAVAEGAAPDPWDVPSLDQSFVDGAAHREPSAVERSATAARQRVIDDQARRGARRRRRRRRARSIAVAVGAAALLLVVVPRLAGGPVPEGGPGATGATGAEALLGRADGQSRPTPVRAESVEPLAEPISSPSVEGPHEFMVTQPDGGEPAAFDRCRPIRVTINPARMPAGAVGVVDDALDEISEAAGVVFEVEEETTERPSEERAPQQARYGDRWAPVLIAWSDEEELAALGGDVAGVGGPVAVNEFGSDRLYLVTGIVVLDGPDAAAILERPEGRAELTAIVLHELGHLLGLDHVSDDSQLMFPEQRELTSLQDGDLAGLRELAEQPCAGQL